MRGGMEHSIKNLTMELSLSEIALSCGGELVLRGGISSDTNVSSIAIDSRKVTEQGAFLATVGERVDGHSFISAVFGQGAVLAVTQKTPEQVEALTGESCDGWGSYVLVKDTLQALKDIAEYYRKKFSVPVVGITGSVGKTSTKEFIAGVLSEKLNVWKTEGNYNNEIGVPLTLLGMRREHDAAVIEMGISDFGEMHRLSKMVRPTVCVITNIGQCHLDNLKTRDGILKAKSEIFDFMSQDAQICLFGGDDKLCALREVKGKTPHFFGWGDNPAEEVSVTEVTGRGLWGSDAVLEMKENCGGEKDRVERLSVHVPLPGAHMVLNSAAAACVARLLGLSGPEIVRGISRIKPVSGRNNLLRLKDYTVIDDCYNANPASMKSAIDLLAMADTEKTAILGDMFELGEDSPGLHREIGAYAASAGIDRILCVGERAEDIYRGALRKRKEMTKVSDKINMAYASGVPEAFEEQIFYFPSRDALLKALTEDRERYMPRGCTALLKASHGMEFIRVLDFLKAKE